MYTIFINDKVVYLTEKDPDFMVDLRVDFSGVELTQTIDEFVDGPKQSLALFSRDLARLWKVFKKEFKVIHAAGGYVLNERQEVLWIFRHNTWDLPKGKVEKHEDLESAAIREVQEECGVTELELLCPMIKTYHVYEHKGKRILKVTHWFKMTSSGEQELKAQTEEGITEVAWLDTVKMQQAFENTYENIKLLCKFAAL